MLLNPQLRARLLSEAGRYTDRAAYIDALSQTSAWGDSDVDRIDTLCRIYDATHSTISTILDRHGLTQTDFSRYFGIPLRTVQGWCNGTRACPSYVLTMASELLQLSDNNL